MAIHPYLGKLSYSANGSVYTDLDATVKLKPPAMSKGVSNTTVLTATGMAKTFQPSWRDSGEISVEVQLAKTQCNTLIGHYQSNTIYYYKVTFPPEGADTNGSTLVAQGFISEFDFSELSAESDEVITCPVKIKLTGAVTFTTGS